MNENLGLLTGKLKIKIKNTFPNFYFKFKTFGRKITKHLIKVHRISSGSCVKQNMSCLLTFPIFGEKKLYSMEENPKYSAIFCAKIFLQA